MPTQANVEQMPRREIETRWASQSRMEASDGDDDRDKTALLVRLEAKPGKEAEVERFLEQELPLAEQEPNTTAWFAIKMGPSTFGITTRSDEGGRQAHLSGRIARALVSKADELLSEPPDIKPIDVIASKLPGNKATRLMRAAVLVNPSVSQ